jgi:hypothetical protein
MKRATSASIISLSDTCGRTSGVDRASTVLDSAIAAGRSRNGSTIMIARSGGAGAPRNTRAPEPKVRGLRRRGADIVSSGSILLVALGALLLLLAIFLPATARIDLSRSVLVRAPVATTWEFVRRMPVLLARHARVREHGGFEDWSLQRGDGVLAGSVWRGRGRWDGGEYWADIEVVRCEPEREFAVRLLRDSLGTHRGLRDHLGSMRLEPIAPAATKLTWRLRARLKGPRLRLARVLSPDLLRARLMDQGMRSIKVAIETIVEAPAAEPPKVSGRPGQPGIDATPPSAPTPRPPDASA